MSPALLNLVNLPEPGLELWPAKNLEEKVETQPQEDVKTLWETKWKSACKRRLHPFQDARYTDVAPIFAELIRTGVTSIDSDAYTSAFLPLADSLADEASKALVHDPDSALQLYLRAVALLRVAGYSSTATSTAASPMKQNANNRKDALYLSASHVWTEESILDQVLIPHIYDPSTDPDEFSTTRYDRAGGRQEARRRNITALVRIPLETVLTGQAVPVALIASRDRTGETGACEEVLRRGWAAVVVEGAEMEEAMWKSVWAWMRTVGFLDVDKVVVISRGEKELGIKEKARGCVKFVSAETKEAVVEESSCCPMLIVSGGGTVKQNGLWTPVVDGEDDEHEDNVVVITESGPGCVGQVVQGDMKWVYEWVEGVMGLREQKAEEVKAWGPLLGPILNTESVDVVMVGA